MSKNPLKNLQPSDYAEGILSQNRTILSQAITIVESLTQKHQAIAEEILTKILPFTGKSIRIGITGVPGVGKSTFIETFGCMLCDQGYKVAVLAIDPSSTLTKGSILGDKVRMEKLSNHPNAFIRPSPSRGVLGGVAQKTREAMFLCEAAGFNVIIIETVGVGQSETTIRSMVDFFLLLVLAGGGDELQGIKKGIMELADAVVVTKADGDNIPPAKLAQADYASALHTLQPPTPQWHSPALMCSAKANTGIQEIWELIQKFKRQMEASDFLEKRRQQQLMDWIHTLVKEQLIENFYNHPSIIKLLPEIEKKLSTGKMPASIAVRTLLSAYLSIS